MSEEWPPLIVDKGHFFAYRMKKNSDYAVMFEVYEVLSCDISGPGYFKEFEMTPREYLPCMDGTDDTEKAHRLYVGRIKWDGCSDYETPDSNNSYHACGNPAPKIEAIWDTLYAKAAELMPEHVDYLLEKPVGEEPK